MMREDRCIICGEKRPGLEVRNDHILESIRWFKRNVTKNEKGYHLIVCKECYRTYKKARDSYVRRQVLYTILGIVFAAFITVFSANRLEALLMGLGIIIFLYMLSLASYMPDIISSSNKE